ncbi:TPA: hypothetical protein ACHWJ6_000987 [Streptococcus suis]|uniref:hypothetical protein n=1 Tax=Streptococcus suis TaxID=1307 RepID=UPI000CF57ACD|nr:hypothetical protein [Streptococcus suis]
MDKPQQVYNKKNPMVRIPRESYDKLVEFCNENDLVISTTIGRFLEYCLENVEFKEVQTLVDKLFIGDCEV